MCRVRPDRIRAPEDYKDVWILNPNSDEIRPYRILVKLYPKNSKDPSSPKNFYKFYNISEIFNECLEKKDKTIYENMDYRGNRNEYPIYLYTQNSEHLTNYLLFKKIDNGYTKEKLQSWAWCLYKSLTDTTIKSKNMTLVSDGTIVYRGIFMDKYIPIEDFQIGRQLYFGNFLSTSTDEEVAKIFTEGKGLFLIITIKNNQKKNYCYEISGISQFNEEEVLIIPFVLFQITNVVHRENLYDIDLDCLGFSH